MDPQQTTTTVKPSFFDDAEPEKYIFWKTEPLEQPSTVKIMEGILSQRCSDASKPHYFILYEDRLAFYKEEDTQGEEELGYCIVQNMRLELLEQQSTEEQKDQKYGFRLNRNRQCHELLTGSKTEQEKWMEAFTRFCVLTQYSHHYSNIKVIGEGRFAWVNLGRRKSDGVEFAVKSFSKQRLASEDKAQASLINEINIMRQLDHEGIIKFYKVYESDNNIYLVLELLHGKELFERIVQKGQYNEHDACILMGKLLGALAHMHAKGIMHRDIKPENLILKDTENDWNVKLADFGLAQVVESDNYLFRRCGTPGYVAPELLAGEKYGDKVDVFSAGLILYILLTGGSPFYAERYEEILWKNQECEISFKFSGHRISHSAVDLMKKMLAKDPAQRISASEALQHEWIVSGGTFLSPKSNNPVYLQLAQENLKKFQEGHGLNQKPRTDEKDVLEKSMHAPSPLITGKTDHLAEAFVFNSPEMMSIGTALANRQRLANMMSPQTGNNNNRRNMFPPRDGQRNGQMNMTMNPTTPNTRNNNTNNNNKDPRFIKQYTGTYGNQGKFIDMSADMATMHSTPKTAPIRPKNFQDMNAQKAMNVHQNFVKYLTANSPQTPQVKPRYMNQTNQQDQQQYYQQQQQGQFQQQQQVQFQQFQQQMQPQFQGQQQQQYPQQQYQQYQQHQFLQQYVQNPKQQYQQQQQQQPQMPQQYTQQQQQQQFQPQQQMQGQFQGQGQQQQQQYPQQQYQPSTKKAKDVSQNLKHLQ